MRFRTVLFDLDGTLIDHFKAIHRCHAFAMQQVGLPAPTYEQVFKAIGGGLDQAIAQLAGPENVDKILPLYLAHWAETNLQDVALLPGAKEILTQLKARGVRNAVLTNKRGPAARQVCDYLGLTPLLEGVFGAGDVAWIKPDPRFAQHALAAIGGEASTSAMVGDSPYDLAAGKNAGLVFFGVTTGTHTAEQLRQEGADYVCTDLAAVGRALGL